MAASEEQRPWSFDVASLMVLVSEGEEESYRLSQRSWLQCLVLAPVVGLQNYIRPYEFLLEPSSVEYFSPDGVKSAPLRYMRLANAIKDQHLLADSEYRVYRIVPDNELHGRKPGSRKYDVLIREWVLFSWAAFAGLLVFCLMVPDTTWIGLANCVAFTGWSLILRIIERVNVRPVDVHERNIALPDEPDAIFILGRNNSAFILEGARRDVKYWTMRGLSYQKSMMWIPASFWQWFTRLGSLVMLLFIFSSIPNGSTMDQVVFIILNGLAQVNVLVGKSLNSARCVAELDLVAHEAPETRTEVYGNLIRRFKELEANKKWIDASGMLPKTSIWEKWTAEVLKDDGRDVKEIYKAEARRANPRVPPKTPTL